MEALLFLLLGAAVGLVFETALDGDEDAVSDEDGDLGDPGVVDLELLGWALDESESTDTTSPDDELIGLGGDDTINGGNGDDTLDGADGMDLLIGGIGNDALSGGDGADVFLTTDGDGDDTIQDLALDDQIQFVAPASAPTISDLGADARIEYDGSNSLTLLGVTAPELVVSGPDPTGDYFVLRVLPQPTAAMIAGDTEADVIEDTASSLTATGTLTISDPNAGEAAFVPQTGTVGTYGVFDLAADGSWTYAADTTQAAIQALDTGDTVSDAFTATSIDGTTQDVIITIEGVTDPVDAAIAGATSGAVTEDNGEPMFATGVLTVTDPNPDEAAFVAQTSTQGVYGTFTLSSDGLWVYEVSNDLARIQRLNVGDALSDVFTVSTVDGASQTITISLNGSDDPVAPIELSAVSQGQGGYVITGAADGDRSGRSVDFVGDVNGDGLGDMLIGANLVDTNGASSGAAYVVFGKSDGLPVDLADVASGTGGFVLNGAQANDRAGLSVSGIGDINGDGLQDLFVGAYLSDTNGNNTGTSYVVFGKADGTAVDLADVEAGNGGFSIVGASGSDQSGISVSGGGDVNGDGVNDLVIGSFVADPNGGASGAAYVVFGKSDTTPVELADVEAGLGGFAMNGANAGDQAGISVAMAGDVNGDGLDDVIVGARYADDVGPDAGAAYVVFGKSDTTAVELSAVTSGTGGFSVTSEPTYERFGEFINAAGDVNGDGLDDVIIGNRLADPGGSNTGQAVVVFGKTDTDAVDLSGLDDGSDGFVIDGISSYALFGGSVSSAGDVNADGFGDLLIGAENIRTIDGTTGGAFVIYGQPTPGEISLSNIAQGEGGFILNGVTAGNDAGRFSSGGGDVNGDGIPDALISAYLADPIGSGSGETYVVWGTDVAFAIDQLGTASADNLVGGAEDDALYGAIGNDTLTGGGGPDRLNGGAGSDTFVIEDLSGTTEIMDFSIADGDVLDVSDFGFDSFSDVQTAMTGLDYQGAVVTGSELPVKATRIELGPDVAIVLPGLKPSDITAGDVVL